MSRKKVSKTIQNLLRKNNKGISLDVGCGENKQEGCVGMDVRKLEGVDIVHNLEKIPYPLPNESCSLIVASHIVEHINPQNFGFINVMNEWWRVMKKGGRLMIAMPYGTSHGFVQDPTHVNPCNETTWIYFDPTIPNSSLSNIYRPKPWKILKCVFSPTGNLEVILGKLGKV